VREGEKNERIKRDAFSNKNNQCRSPLTSSGGRGLPFCREKRRKGGREGGRTKGGRGREKNESLAPLASNGGEGLPF